ncbi:Efflux pump dotC like protein [Verticillium longisporum]|uniref:Efflux pump dotC like protein n=1 Tax=Verticillium longisporum TaxID=100787 RepID=A0A8I2ZJJ2_VERLO|nr:Efflux pump dotC like protein [Verticillium longisporum]
MSTATTTTDEGTKPPLEEPATDSSQVDVDVEKQDAAASQDEPPAKLPPGAKAGLTVRQFWLAMLGLNVGMLLTALDFNIVATAVPIISSEFKEYNNSAWLGTSFLITFAIIMPITSKLSDAFGRKNVFLAATVVFIIGSALCGWSNSMNMLIASRAVQGLGAGGIYGLVNVILTDLVPLQDVGKYLAVTAIVWGIADIAGPLLGGAFSQYVVPLSISPTQSSIICLRFLQLQIRDMEVLLLDQPHHLTHQFRIVAIVLKLPHNRNTTVKEEFLKFDYLGTVLISGGTTTLVLGLQWGGNIFPWGDAKVIGTLVGGFAMIVLFYVSVHFAKDPLIFPSMFKSRTLICLFIAEFFFGVTLLGTMYYVPQFFQLVFGDTAILSGVGLLPMMLGLIIGNPIAAWVTSKYGVTIINAVVGAGLEILACGLMTRWNANTPRAEAIVVLIILGIGMGAVMSALLLSCQVSVPPAQIGVVTGLAIFIQTVGDMFGIAIFAAVYLNRLKSILQGLGLTADQVGVVLLDVQHIRQTFSGDQLQDIIDVYARSLQNGWWFMFAAASAVLVFSAVCRQYKFGDK